MTDDLEIAKNIKKEELRLHRKVYLEQQDNLYEMAILGGIDTIEILREKQRLRNITLEVDSCTTLEEIKSIKLEEE